MAAGAALNPETPLAHLPLAVVDFEATGFPGPDAHIVEVAVVHIDLAPGSVPTVGLSSLVRPPVPILEQSTRVHGITDADVAEAPAWRDLVDAFDAATAGRLVVAFNAFADFTYARVEAARLEREPPAWPWLDAFVLRKRIKTRGAPGKLVEVAAGYGYTLDAHGALADAATTALIIRPLLVDLWALHVRPRTVGELLTWQTSAALAQERDYAEYCRSRGDYKPPRCDWHLAEGKEPPSWPPPVRATACRCGALITHHVGRDGALGARTLAGEAHACEAA